MELRDLQTAGGRKVRAWMWVARMAGSGMLAFVGLVVTALAVGH